MAHLSNPLATVQQLDKKSSQDSLPIELQDSIRFSIARLTQAAGVLLRLPQSIGAQAVVLLYRYWLVNDFMFHEFSDVSAASLYLTAKISASPRSLRSITNTYAYLLSSSSYLDRSSTTLPLNDPSSYYLSESAYVTFRNRVLIIEGHILNALGFNTHVALPHPLAITYLQTLDVFGASQPKGTGNLLAKRTVEYLNSALLSPQCLYLTHQPNALATAAIYLAARDVGAKLPETEWWEVFDTDREELGFLVLGMRSLEGWVIGEGKIWGKKAMPVLTRAVIREEAGKRGQYHESALPEGDDEEAEMGRLLDEKVG